MTTLEVANALALVLAHAKARPPEVTALSTTALGQVLAADLVADLDSPPFAKALMDGFAVRAADLPGGTGTLALAGSVAAGDAGSLTVDPGGCVAITTGAPLPAGADAVVKVELTSRAGDTVAVADPALVPGRNVLPRGAEMRAGAVVLPAGTVLSPVAFGLCAAIGKTAVPAVPPARVAVICTGSELVEANTKPRGGQIRNTNGPMLVALVTRAGGLPRYLGIGRDDATILGNLVREGLATTDIVVLSGGVSVGAFDLIPGVLAAAGVTARFHTVRMKPGKPIYFGTATGPKGDPRLVFGLPGNPVSALVGFTLFVRPALRVLAGLPDPGPTRRTLPLTEAFTATNDRPTFHPGRLTAAGVTPLPWGGSADLRAMLGADVLLCLPAGEVRLAAGDGVEVAGV